MKMRLKNSSSISSSDEIEELIAEGLDEDDCAILELRQEIKIRRKNISNYEEKLKALKEI